MLRHRLTAYALGLALATVCLAAVGVMAYSLSPPWRPSLVLALLCVATLVAFLLDRRFIAVWLAGAASLAAGHWAISLMGSTP